MYSFKKSYIDIEQFFAKDTPLYTHFCTVDHIVGNASPLEIQVERDLLRKFNILGHSISDLFIEIDPLGF